MTLSPAVSLKRKKCSLLVWVVHQPPPSPSIHVLHPCPSSTKVDRTTINKGWLLFLCVFHLFLTLFCVIVVVVVCSLMKFPFFDFPNGFQGWLCACLIVALYHLFIVTHLFLFFSLDCNPMPASHTLVDWWVFKCNLPFTKTTFLSAANIMQPMVFQCWFVYMFANRNSLKQQNNSKHHPPPNNLQSTPCLTQTFPT